jgi:hypothetical protein
MAKRNYQVLKWLPLAAIGMAFPAAYFWLFLWCLNLKVSFWLVYAVIYGGGIAYSISSSSKTQTTRKNPKPHLYLSTQAEIVAEEFHSDEEAFSSSLGSSSEKGLSAS